MHNSPDNNVLITVERLQYARIIYHLSKIGVSKLNKTNKRFFCYWKNAVISSDIPQLTLCIL
jgi:hypothetical protein